MKFKSPVYHVVAVPIDKIVPNTYNPNTVAPPEMKLLYDSIKQDVEQQSVAVRFGGHEIIAAHHGSAAGLVVQNDFLPQQFFHSGEHDPDNAIRAGPCPKGQNHGDGAVWIGSTLYLSVAG